MDKSLLTSHGTFVKDACEFSADDWITLVKQMFDYGQKAAINPWRKFEASVPTADRINSEWLNYWNKGEIVYPFDEQRTYKIMRDSFKSGYWVGLKSLTVGSADK